MRGDSSFCVVLVYFQIRWVVESANSRIKKWRYMANVLPNNQVPHIGDYVRIICAISNKFEPPLSQGNQEDDETLGCRMLYLSKQVNSLKTYIEEHGLDKRKVVWKPVDECDNFPLLDEEDLVNITCGVYQLKLASNYIQEHIDNGSEISIHKDDPTLLRVAIQSRHISSKRHLLWIRFSEVTIESWYCKCRAGARVVGMCSHVAAVLWYLGFARHKERNTFGVKDWGEYLDDAAVVDKSESDSDESVIEE